MMDMNKTKELAWELGQKLGEVAEDAYKQGYTNGIKDGYEPLDENITAALCSLPKIQSSDGQEYVQLADVLETVRRYLGDCISKTEAIKTIQQHGIGCFDSENYYCRIKRGRTGIT